MISLGLDFLFDSLAFYFSLFLYVPFATFAPLAAFFAALLNGASAGM
ncbi:MAG: hypothetical protein IPK83_11885 [Planctomycetes bacterium]|nr:hypothetical protein [Planctomycetota bacterium]